MEPAKNSSKVEKICFRFYKGSANVILAVLFVVLFVLFLNGFHNYGDAAFIASFAKKGEMPFLAFLSFSFFALLFIAGGKKLDSGSDRVQIIIRICMTIFCLIVQGFFLFYINSYYKWDSGFVIGGAASLLETGKVTDEAFYYLSVYPNQNTFVLITAGLIKFANLLGVAVSNRPLVFNIFNTICMDVSIYLVYRMLVKLCGNEKKNRIFLFLILNPFLYLGVSYYYTITLSWPFTAGFLYLALFSGKNSESCKCNKNKIVRFLLAGLLLGIGYELRATAIIFAIAAVLVCLMKALHQDKKELIVKTAIIALVAMISAKGLSFIQTSFVGIDTRDTAFPTMHWIMMSMTEPGGHNAEDESFTASFATKEEKEAAVKNRIKEKVQAMGVKGYGHLVWTKLERTFGDGMNGYVTFLSDGYGTGSVYEHIFGSKKDFVILYHQGYYLFLMFGVLASIVICFRKNQKEERSKEFFSLATFILIIFGAILFYILWEASEQYSVPFMPVFLVLGIYGFDQIVFEKKWNCFTEKKNVLDSAFKSIPFVLAILFLVWAVLRCSAFTKNVYDQSTTSAVQIMANAPTYVDDGTKLVQNIKTKAPFSHLVMQWRNPLEALNDAVYEVKIQGVNPNGGEPEVYLSKQIVASESGYNGAGIYDTDKAVFPKETGCYDYQIIIQKISGSKDCDLQFVLYDMYGYTPYPGGDLVLEKEDGEKTVKTASLLFLLSYDYAGVYCSLPQYILFCTCIFLFFIFIGFCSKIDKIGCPIKKAAEGEEKER